MKNGAQHSLDASDCFAAICRSRHTPRIVAPLSETRVHGASNGDAKYGSDRKFSSASPAPAWGPTWFCRATVRSVIARCTRSFARVRFGPRRVSCFDVESSEPSHRRDGEAAAAVDTDALALDSRATRLTFRRFIERLYYEFTDDAVTDSAAQLSYYLLLALFPFLFFLVTLAAYMPLGEDVNNLFARAQAFVPEQALAPVQEHVSSLLDQTRPNLLTLGLVTALWSASRGIDAIRKALNLAYDVKESRPWWKVQGLAVAMTLSTAILVLLSVAVFLLGGKLGFWLSDQLGIARAVPVLWSLARWPVTGVVIMLALALTYYILPDVEQKLKYIAPGAILSGVLWLLATWGFTQYVDHFGNYNVTYGSIGGVVVLLVWLYICGVLVILGAEVNAILEQASNQGKAAGARRFGETPRRREIPPIVTLGSEKR
jgi:membrane protein